MVSREVKHLTHQWGTAWWKKTECGRLMKAKLTTMELKEVTCQQCLCHAATGQLVTRNHVAEK